MLRVAVLGAMALAATGCSYTLPSVPTSATVEPESSTVYAADGSVLVVLHAEENRRSIDLADVPRHVQHAVIAAEDRRFYEHNGVDVQALLRAARVDVLSGEVTQGGSTITQQYVKIAVLEDAERTVERKIRETLLALGLERERTKAEILELYLNAVYFGHGAYGIEAAADQYFGKAARDLTVTEGALLAGLIRSPERLDPWERPDEARRRRDQVLAAMVDEGFVDDDEARAGAAEAIVLADPFPPALDRYPAAHFVEEVKRVLLDDPAFGPTPLARRDRLFAGGLAIHTTLDPWVQAAAEFVVAARLPPGTGPAAAVVAVEPSSGAVRAMVGGPDFFGPGAAARFNLATQGGRQAGSAFKPLVLAAALEQGMPLSTRFPAPGELTTDLPDGQRWHVRNYDGDSPEPELDLVEATVRSVNTVYAQLVMAVGPDVAVEAAARYGIASPLRAVPSAVLGANDVTPLDMATAYATIANRGTRIAPWVVAWVEDRDGTLLYEHHADPIQAMAPEVADTVTAVLEQAVQRGTGRAARLDRPVAGKTGTAQEWRDAWFCGFTPDLATVVWVGFPEGQVSMRPPATPLRVTGGSWPAAIWHDVMAAAVAPLPPRGFTPPPPGALPEPAPEGGP